MEFMIWLVAGLVVGAAVGAVSVWMLRGKQSSPAVSELKKENDRFRNEVTDHFVETARLINELTDSYKAVFDHLSKGADTLVEDQVLAERMPRVSAREVRLRHLGTTTGETSASEQTGSERKTSGADPLRKGELGKGELGKGELGKGDSGGKAQPRSSD